MTSIYRQNDRWKSIVPSILEQIPTQYREDDSTFRLFIEAYFEWLEQEKNAVDRVYSLETIRDPDFGVLEFYSSLKKELAPLLPGDVVADRALLLKRISDFYRAKGRDGALQFFFKAVYGVDADIEYPLERLDQQPGFRPSGSASIRVNIEYTANPPASEFVGRTVFAYNTDDPDNDPAAVVVGTAIVQFIEEKTISATTYVELQLTNFTGEFPAGKVLRTEDTDPSLNNISGLIYSIVSGYRILDGGDGYVDGSVVAYTAPFSGQGFSAIVNKVRGSVFNVDVIEAGLGYQTAPSVTVVGDNLPSDPQASFSVNLGPNGEIDSVTVINAGDEYTNIDLILSGGNPQVPGRIRARLQGEILSLNVLDRGIDYDNVPVNNPLGYTFNGVPYGSGSNITFVLGTIPEQELGTQQSQASFTQNYNWLYGLGAGTGDFVVGQPVTQPDGNFTGIVSKWDPEKKLLYLEKNISGEFREDLLITQAVSSSSYEYNSIYSRPLLVDAGDNQKHVEYTYTIKTSITVNEYRSDLKKNAHVAGTQFIGVVSIITESGAPGVGQFDMRLYHYDLAAGPNTLTPNGRMKYRQLILNIFNNYYANIDDVRNIFISDIQDMEIEDYLEIPEGRQNDVIVDVANNADQLAFLHVTSSSFVTALKIFLNETLQTFENQEADFFEGLYIDFLARYNRSKGETTITDSDLVSFPERIVAIFTEILSSTFLEKGERENFISTILLAEQFFDFEQATYRASKIHDYQYSIVDQLDELTFDQFYEMYGDSNSHLKLILPIDVRSFNASSGFSAFNATATISLPAGYEEGDLFVLHAAYSENNNFGAPVGWTEFGTALATGGSWRNKVFYRIADGSEGASVTITFGENGRKTVSVYCIRKGTYDPSFAPEGTFSGSGNVSGITPAVPAPITPSWGGVDYLVILMAFQGGGSNVSIDLPYSDNVIQETATSSQGSSVVTSSACTTISETETFQPGNINYSGPFSYWGVWTVAVKPLV